MSSPKSPPELPSSSPPPTVHLAKLRAAPHSLHNPSDILHRSRVPAGAPERTRTVWLKAIDHHPGPVIAKAHFIPLALAEHLFRNKRDSALATKYLPRTAITNMEGALHSFVTPLVKIEQAGDYVWSGQHSMLVFPAAGAKQMTRRCVLSATIHPDFEDYSVGHQLYGLRQGEVRGIAELLNFAVPSNEAKASASARAVYDAQLHSLAVYHLTASHSLPSASDARPWTHAVAAAILRKDLATEKEPPMFVSLAGRSVMATPAPLSLEMLLNTYICSLASEFSALEAFCSQGRPLSEPLARQRFTLPISHRLRLHLRPTFHLRGDLLRRTDELAVHPRSAHGLPLEQASRPPYLRI